MNLFIQENESKSIGTCSGNEANPGVQGVQPVSLGDAMVRLAMTGVAFGLGSHLFHRSHVWCQGEIQKQDTRLKGIAPEVNLGIAQREAEECLKTEEGKNSKKTKVGQKRQEISEKGQKVSSES